MSVLDGQVAVVTGAGSGIGKAVAERFAALGAQVVLVGRRREALAAVEAGIVSGGGRALVFAADLTEDAQVDGLAQEVLGRFNRIDVVVNNAGLNVPRRDLHELGSEDWRAVVAANLTAPFLVTRALLPAMRAARRGTIINLSSMAGRRASELSGPAYSAAKAGLNSFTESINVAERRYGIRACVICPGEVDTPILALRPCVPSAEARATMMQPEDVAAAVVLVTTLPRRAAIDAIDMRPTVLRDLTEERRRAQGKR